MYYSLRGTVIEIRDDYLVLDVHDVGYAIYLAHLERVEIGETYLVYTHLSIRENEQVMFGFLTLVERDVFLKLIEIKGVGPKTALALVSHGDINDLVQAIEQENVRYFKSIPGVGPKLASQIIFDLTGKLHPKNSVTPVHSLAIEALKNLGFKAKEIDDAYRLCQNEIQAEMDENMILRILLQKIRRK